MLTSLCYYAINSYCNWINEIFCFCNMIFTQLRDVSDESFNVFSVCKTKSNNR